LIKRATKDSVRYKKEKKTKIIGATDNISLRTEDRPKYQNTNKIPYNTTPARIHQSRPHESKTPTLRSSMCKLAITD